MNRTSFVLFQSICKRTPDSRVVLGPAGQRLYLTVWGKLGEHQLLASITRCGACGLQFRCFLQGTTLKRETQKSKALCVRVCVYNCILVVYKSIAIA